MQKFWTWLRMRFLPEWARRQLEAENKDLTRQLANAQAEVQRLEAYIQGMHDGLRKQRGVVIHNGEGAYQ